MRRREVDMKWRWVIVVIMILACAGCAEADAVLTIEDIRESWKQERETGTEPPSIEGRRYSLFGVVTGISDIHPAYRVSFDGGYMDIHEAIEVPEVGTVIDEIVTIYDATLVDGLAVLRGYAITEGRRHMQDERGESQVEFGIGMVLFVAIIVVVFLIGGSIAGELHGLVP